MYWIPCYLHQKQTRSGFLVPCTRFLVLFNQGRLVLDSLFHIFKALDWVFPSAKADLYLIPCSLYPRKTCTEFLLPIYKVDMYWIPCYLHQKQTRSGFLVPCIRFLVLFIQGRLVLDFLSLMSKADWFLVPLSKADMYWIPCSHQPNQTCIGFFIPLPKADLFWIPCPFIHSSYVLDTLLLKSKEDSLSSLPKADLYWNPRPLSQGRLVLDSLSHYSRQTCTGLGVPISQGRHVLDSWFPIPKDYLSHKPR